MDQQIPVATATVGHVTTLYEVHSENLSEVTEICNP